MKTKNKKSVLVVIIILLCISLPMGIGGIVLKMLGNEGSDGNNKIAGIPDNPNKDFFHEGYIYFYDNNNLLGAYKCENPDGVCDYAYETIDDEDYSVNFYNDDQVDKLKIISNQFVFINDAATTNDDKDVILYDMKNNRKIATYKAVKNYTIGIENNIFIIQNTENKWAVVSLQETPFVIISFDYDYIGLSNKKNNSNQLIGENFIVKKGNDWSIIDTNEAELSSKISDEIVDYNGNEIIAKLNDRYYLYSYQGNLILDANGYLNLSFTGKYINILDVENKFYVFDYQTNSSITPKIDINGQPYSSQIVDGKLKVTIGNNIETYDL